MTCSTEHDPVVLDPASPLYDAECEWKQRTAQAIAAHNVRDPSTRDLAGSARLIALPPIPTTLQTPFPPPPALCTERFARSGINFSLLFADTSKLGVRGANPAAVTKLFEQSAVVGGASGVDRAMGALKWQKDDITFKMTGDAGRINWAPRNSRALKGDEDA